MLRLRLRLAACARIATATERCFASSELEAGGNWSRWVQCSTHQVVACSRPCPHLLYVPCIPPYPAPCRINDSLGASSSSSPSPSPNLAYLVSLLQQSLPAGQAGFLNHTPTSTQGAVSGLRCMSTLSKSGVPGPYPQVSTYLSTPRGGHINRLLLRGADSLMLLDEALWKNRKKLEVSHVAVAARRLGHLARCAC